MDVTVTSLGLRTKVCARCSPPTRSLTEFSKSSPGIHRCALSGGQRHCSANLPIRRAVWRARRLSGRRSPPPGPGLLRVVIRAPGKHPPQHGVGRRRPSVSHRNALFLRRHLLGLESSKYYFPHSADHHTVPSQRGPYTSPPPLQQITSKNLHTKSFSCRHLAWSGRRQGEAPELHGIDHWPASTHRRQGRPSLTCTSIAGCDRCLPAQPRPGTPHHMVTGVEAFDNLQDPRGPRLPHHQCSGCPRFSSSRSSWKVAHQGPISILGSTSMKDPRLTDAPAASNHTASASSSVHPRALGAVPDSQVPGIKLSRGRPAISAGIDWYVRMDSSFVRLHGHGNSVTQCSQGTCQLSPCGEEFCIDGFIGPGRLLLFALSICWGKEDGIRAHRPYIQSAISIEQVNEISTTPAPDIGHHPITLKLIGR